MQKKIRDGTQEESSLSDSGETEAGVGFQFGDLIRRKRETYCGKLRRNQQE